MGQDAVALFGHDLSPEQALALPARLAADAGVAGAVKAFVQEYALFLNEITSEPHGYVCEWFVESHDDEDEIRLYGPPLSLNVRTALCELHPDFRWAVMLGADRPPVAAAFEHLARQLRDHLGNGPIVFVGSYVSLEWDGPVRTMAEVLTVLRDRPRAEAYVLDLDAESAWPGGSTG